MSFDYIKVLDYSSGEGKYESDSEDYVEIHYGIGDRWFAIKKEEAQDLIFKLIKYIQGKDWGEND